jgi:hypothetical protein
MTCSAFRLAPLAIVLTLGLLGGCRKDNAAAPEICISYPVACNTPATVRDLTGLDGCGKVLELANGQRLEPHGTVWNSFTSTNGQQVFINYTPTPNASICMVGQTVEITCIHAAN